MKMTLKKRVIYVIALTLINFIGLSVLAVVLDSKFLGLAIFLPLFSFLYIFFFRCTNCGSRIYKNNVIFREKKLLLPKHCDNCGCEL